MPLEMQGFDDLENDLTNMAAALEFGPGVDRALQAGAKPIEEQMLHNASTDPKIITGALHDSIHTGKVKRRSAGRQGRHHRRASCREGRVLRKPGRVRAPG